jgi:hypothetical protein
MGGWTWVIFVDEEEPFFFLHLEFWNVGRSDLKLLFLVFLVLEVASGDAAGGGNSR